MENKIKNDLKTKLIGRHIVYFEETDSTNDLAKRNSHLDNGTVFIADTQTRGKGRLGREWVSGKGMGVWLSILLKPQIPIDEVSKITLVAGVAACEAIGYGAKIKYPNDIVIGTKKVCGILTECSQSADGESYIVCGIGINVNQESFGGELKNKATSLYEITKQHLKREDIIRKLLEEFEKAYNVFLKSGFWGIAPKYKNNCINIGREIKATYQNKEVFGKCTDITNDGEIVVETQNGVLKINSGEVSVRGIYGYV